MIDDFLKRVETLGYMVKKNEGGDVFIGFECCFQWRFFLKNTDSDKVIPYFYYRQQRVEEVTDLHEIIPSVLAAITKSYGNSSFRFLGETNEFSCIEDELYGMYWFPTQPLNEHVRKNNEQDFECLFKILTDLYMFHLHQGDVLGICPIQYEDYFSDSPKLNAWVSKIHSFIGENESYVANGRINPSWFYFRSYSSAFSIVYSPHIAGVLNKRASAIGAENILDGVTSKIEIYKNIRTIIPFEYEKLVKELLETVEDYSEVNVITQENQLVFISDSHIVFVYCNCGSEYVSYEKELIRQRQQKEISLLFGDRKFLWNIIDRQSSSDFEDLILELLNREPWVYSVKKVAPTNQGDNGRDLICEYDMMHDERGVSRRDSALKLGKMIIQCKTNLKSSKKSSIGKSDVDVANTIFDYRPDGYMLVVNTQITRDLTEMLERQKERKEQNTIRWWNAFDIEDRLRKYPDILVRYRHLVDYE
ncbi:hypothetical protein NU090_003530 [Salmonella enterica]|uniref:restriction endonuclease n=1 Tax=Klebsiella aerogenes TaxID=548 RepID=UPI000FBAA254|nr:hypothetical protein [Salmonella enterica]ECA4080707.1 hypothetical protein [Salmonella enterica subsp. enterica serovar Texas]EDX2434835.1 hypothetical protein [Salmonella enterica subsp. enterica serovar Koenigstuhl]EAW0647683.1 hypothetical protein [Salmonella enterica]EAX8476079.1 hypothetical protein [Salmonella enterica]